MYSVHILSGVSVYLLFKRHGIDMQTRENIMVKPKLLRLHSACFIHSCCRRLAHACIKLGQC